MTYKNVVPKYRLLEVDLSFGQHDSCFMTMLTDWPTTLVNINQQVSLNFHYYLYRGRFFNTVLNIMQCGRNNE